MAENLLGVQAQDPDKNLEKARGKTGEALPMTEQLTAEHFRPHVTKVFHVRGGRHSLTLTALEAFDLSEAQRQLLSRPPFTLIFAGPPGDVLPEGEYAFEVEGGPAFEFYVMPIHTAARDRQDYQAAFN
jgi:hypothetical protein